MTRLGTCTYVMGSSGGTPNKNRCMTPEVAAADNAPYYEKLIH